MALSLALLLIGFVVLIKGADFLVNGSSSIAKKFKISDIAIGLTVVSLGTSAPELLISVTSSFKGHNDAAFGNIIGSNITNLLLILGVAGIIYPLIVQRNTIKFEVPISMFAVLLTYLLVNDQRIWGSASNELSRWDAAILLACFLLFMAYVYKTIMSSPALDEGRPIKLYTVPVSVGLILAGLTMLVVGGTIVVDNAVTIAEHFNLSHRLIGLTILATGTSLPELATSAVAAYRKNTDIAIGNVVGSNIFNLFFILGITGMVHPLTFDTALNFDLYILIGSTIILIIFMFTLTRNKLDRWEATLLFLGYFTYLTYLVANETGMLN